MRKKILHLITGLEIGGAELMLLKTLPRLTKFQHIVCAIKEPTKIGKELEKNNIRVYYLKAAKKFCPQIIWEFYKIIKKEKPDILITYLIHADFFGRIFGKLFGVKKIICSLRNKHFNKKFLLLEKLTSFLVTHYLANSNAVRDFYASKLKIPPKKITVISNGVEIKKFSINIDEAQKRKELGLEEKDFLIGCIANFKKQKGHQYLLKAFKKVINKYPDIKLILAGEGKEEKHLKKLAFDLKLQKQVIFLGQRNDIPELLKIINIFVLPTLYEGMPNVILEAMAAKRPIITTNIPENQELIENQKQGLLVPVKAPKELAQAMFELIKNPEKRNFLANNAFEKAKSHFSLDKTIKSLENFLLNFLK